MNDFEATLLKLVDEAKDLQQKEKVLQVEATMFNQKLTGFLKENGLPEDFTIPQLAVLCIRKSRELIKV